MVQNQDLESLACENGTRTYAAEACTDNGYIIVRNIRPLNHVASRQVGHLLQNESELQLSVFRKLAPDKNTGSDGQHVFYILHLILLSCVKTART
jgi:hypothetical protein